MRIKEVIVAGVVAGFVVGCFALASIGAMSVARGGQQIAQVLATNQAVHEYLTIESPDMLGNPGGPAYVPSNITFPANTDVTVTIANFDSGDGLTGTFATPTGTIGKITYQTMDTGNPSAAGAPISFDSSKISHTFTIVDLGLNVPILANSRTTFTFHTPGAGKYNWRCFVPCGTGVSGWGGAMSKDGYMQGTVTFA